MSCINIHLETLTVENFAPYGAILNGRQGEPSFSRPLLENWRTLFSSDAPPRLQIMRYHRQSMRFSKLERYLNVTEARCPIGTARAVLIVAGKTNPKNLN